MSKIQNIVFDIGNVLMNWDPKGIYKNLFGKNDYYDHPLSKIVGGEVWLELDRGTIELDAAIEKLSILNEPYGKEIDKFIREAPEHIHPIMETVDFAIKYKKMGFNIYLLSNFPEYGYKIIRNRFDFFNQFHGAIISWEVKAIKPELEIYNILLKKYQLIPENTLFIDDLEANIRAAEVLGIKGIHFADGTNLPMELEKITTN
jgi:HAD superfamily hydrolase (TIGR01509 family)